MKNQKEIDADVLKALTMAKEHLERLQKKLPPAVNSPRDEIEKNERKWFEVTLSYVNHAINYLEPK